MTTLKTMETRYKTLRAHELQFSQEFDKEALASWQKLYESLNESLYKHIQHFNRKKLERKLKDSELKEGILQKYDELFMPGIFGFS